MANSQNVVYTYPGSRLLCAWGGVENAAMRRLALAAFVVFGILAGGLAAAEKAAGPINPADYKDAIRVACVGDSITYGAGVKDREVNCYPAVLGRMLGEKWAVKNFGVSGATMLKKGDKPYMKEKAFAAALEFKPNVLIIKLGTNDTKPQNWKHKDDFAADAKDLIAEFRKIDPKVRVYVCLPVPGYPGNWGINDETIKGGVLPILQEVAKETQASVIDLYTALSGKPQMFPDKVHPNVEGAALIAATVFRALTGREPPAAKGAASATELFGEPALCRF
ncbi:MAG: GDSL-type esterase/lipase family protein [Planctomycetota bacterium]|nr:GDSL-type esterase/lipase family protein [Planctomycetota bacterium]